MSVVLLVGLLGGLALGAFAGARTTSSSFATYLRSTNPSSTTLATGFRDPQLGSNVGFSPLDERAIATLPFVRHAADIIGFDGNLDILSVVHGNAGSGGKPAAFVGSLDGEYLTQDRVTLVQGRMADPADTSEFMMSANAVAAAGMHVGSTIRIGFYTDAQANSSNCCHEPYLSITLKLVGIFVTSTQVVQDDNQKLGSQLAILTPALTRKIAVCCAYYSGVAVQIAGGARHEAAVLAEAKRRLPHDLFLSTEPGAQFISAKADRVIRPDALLLAAFGVFAAIAALLIGGQVIGRSVRRSAQDGQMLRELGASPAMTMANAAVGALVAVFIGSLLAAAVAVLISPLAPIGPVRPYYPNRGLAVDALVLGVGLPFLLVAFCAMVMAIAIREAPRRHYRAHGTRRDSQIIRVAAAFGMGPAALAGLRSALETRTASARSVPIRSTMIGAIAAAFVIVTVATFGSSLNTLVSSPRLYGWNWDYVMFAGFSGDEDLPAAEASNLLAHDPFVSASSGVYFEGVSLDGRVVPALAGSPRASVGPTLLSGHALQSANQVVLGPTTLSALHLQVGGSVLANTGIGPSRRLRVVGVATMPTIGAGGSPSLQMGAGAWVSSSLFSASLLNPQQSSVPGPNAYLIRIRPGSSSTAALKSLDRINLTLQAGPDGAGGVVSVLRPAEIADYRSLESTPFLLAIVLAASAIGALGLTLTASVRSRRRELALLKALGFTRRQLLVSVTLQSTSILFVGILLGMPLGIAFGRWLWSRFAEQISAVPHPVVPLQSLVLIALVGLALANLVAALPGRIAARTPTALMLRSE